MIPAKQLVELALERLGLGEKDSAELAKRLGLTAYSSPQRVRRWLSGENEPDYAATMRLLEIVGAIRWEALDDRLRADEAADAALRDAVAQGTETGKIVQQRLQRRGHGSPRRETG